MLGVASQVWNPPRTDCGVVRKALRVTQYVARGLQLVKYVNCVAVPAATGIWTDRASEDLGGR
jgi:hypothetical protein